MLNMINRSTEHNNSLLVKIFEKIESIGERVSHVHHHCAHSADNVGIVSVVEDPGIEIQRYAK